jgi:hypothetical protein
MRIPLEDVRGAGHVEVSFRRWRLSFQDLIHGLGPSKLPAHNE